MNLHEFQGKLLLKRYHVCVPKGIVVENSKEAAQAANLIKDETNTAKWAVKAQIHAGGRGKAGGVKIASTLEEVTLFSNQIIGKTLVTPQTGSEGKLVRKVLIEENIYYEGSSKIQEFYLAFLLNRKEERNMLIYSPRGGMDIEKVAEETPELIFKEIIDPLKGIQETQCESVTLNLKLTGKAAKLMKEFVGSLYQAYIHCDASLCEINPVVKTSDDKIIAADCKFSIDNNALYRHPDIIEMRDLTEEDPMEVEAGQYDLNYIRLSGNVGCMVNGAGLAMATMDIIKLSGGEPANFLDVGGSADAKRVEQGFRIILKDSNVKAILLNVFGGIVRCDRVAQGIVDAYKNIGTIEMPIIVRLQGTNAEEGRQIINDSGLKVFPVSTLQEAADKVRDVVSC